MKARKAERTGHAAEATPTDRQAGPTPALPTVWELGLIAERLRTMAREIDKTPAEDRSVANPYRMKLDKELALCVARDREHATVDLLLTLPAQNLRDAAVQLHHCWFLLDQLEADDPGQTAIALRSLRTTLSSVGGAVLTHSGLDYIGSGIDFTEMLDQWTNIHLEVTKLPA